MIWIVSLIFCSSIFWMKNSIDLAPWAFFEVISDFLLIRLLFLKKELKIPEKNIFLPLLALLFLTALSLSWSSHFHATLMSLYKVVFILILFVLFMTQKSEWENALIKSVLAFSGIGSLGTLVFPQILDTLGMHHPSLFYGFLAQGGILAFGLFLMKKGKPYCILSLGIGCSLIISKSLAPLLGWSFGIMCATFFYDRKKISLVIVCLCGLFLLSFLHWEGNPLYAIWERKSEDAFTLERIAIWQDSLNYFLDHPLLGTGWGTFRDFYPQYKSIEGTRVAPYAHNLPLQILCELGLAGFLLFLWLGVFTLKIIFQHHKIPDSQGVWGSLLGGTFFQSLFDFNLHFPLILFLFLFSLSFNLPFRIGTWDNKKSVKTGIVFCFIFLAFLMGLPGMAEIYFKWHYSNPSQRISSAIVATELDPFNAYYRMETGRKRDLFIALDLEPRNVWFKREYAQILSRENLPEAIKQYAVIIPLAPNVESFRKEAQNLISLSRNLKKSN